MKIRDEIFAHSDWWQTNFPINELNETDEEFDTRVAYLRYIEPNPMAVREGFFDSNKFEYETIDEYRARLREYYLSIDLGVNEKVQDGYYLDIENINKEILTGLLYYN